MMRRAGFTVIELIVTIAIVGIAATVFAGPISAMVDMLVWDRARHDVVDSSRHTFDRAVFELKNVRDESAITAAQTNFVDFRNTAGEFRRLWVPAGTNTLRLYLDAQFWPLSDYVDTFNLFYYDRDGNALNSLVSPVVPAADLPKIHTIRMEVDFQSPYLAEGGYSLATEVRPFNLSDREEF